MKNKKIVDEIYTSTVKLQRPVGDIHTIQKSDLDRSDFNEDKISVSELLNSVIKEFKPIAITKNIKKLVIMVKIYTLLQTKIESIKFFQI